MANHCPAVLRIEVFPRSDEYNKKTAANDR